MLSGCFFHRTHPVQTQAIAPPPSQPPQLKPAPVDLPLSATTIPPLPIENARVPTEPTPSRRHRKTNKNLQEAAIAAPAPMPSTPALSAIGQLSSGDPADVRQETEESIASIEKELNGISRTLDGPKQKTADQIREFLKQARAALLSGDVDGAHTLAAKAKVLLAELTH
jgi:hypothetical protein